MKEAHDELLKPGFNSFGLGDCKAPKVLGDIVESIAGAIFLDSGRDTAAVWRVSFGQGTEFNVPENSPCYFSYSYMNKRSDKGKFCSCFSGFSTSVASHGHSRDIADASCAGTARAMPATS